MQKTITFEKARDRASHLISRLAEYAEQFQEYKGGLGFGPWEQTLRVIEKKVSFHNEPFQCVREAEEIFKFGHNLANVYQPLENQLNDFCHLWYDAFKIWKISPQRYSSFKWWEIDSNLHERIVNADKMAFDVVTSVRDNPKDLLAAHALLNIHVVRTESIEYANMRILRKCIHVFKLGKKYDAASICSVTRKVQKGTYWVSDARAIRDAISHQHYKIKIDGDGWIVTFSNTERGYNFQQTFSHSEFIRFFDQHTLLYKVQLALLNTLEVLSIFANYLCKEPELG